MAAWDGEPVHLAFPLWLAPSRPELEGRLPSLREEWGEAWAKLAGLWVQRWSDAAGGWVPDGELPLRPPPSPPRFRLVTPEQKRRMAQPDRKWHGKLDHGLVDVPAPLAE
jgi:hypothetical protein